MDPVIRFSRTRCTSGALSSLGVWQIHCQDRPCKQQPLQCPLLVGLQASGGPGAPLGEDPLCSSCGSLLSLLTASGPVCCPAHLHPHSWPLSTAVRGPLPCSEASATSSHNIIVRFLYLTLNTFLPFLVCSLATVSSTLCPSEPPATLNITHPFLPLSCRPHTSSHQVRITVQVMSSIVISAVAPLMRLSYTPCSFTCLVVF